MTAEQKVKAVYPEAYMAYNSLFETFRVYENHTMRKGISDRFQRVYEAWEDAAKRIDSRSQNSPVHVSRNANESEQ